MNTKNTVILSVILIILATLIGIVLYPRFPAQMASHWGADNQVNGYMPRFWGVFMMPLVALGMLLLFLAIPLIDPLKANIAKFRGYFNTFIFLLIVFLFYVEGLTLVWNLGYSNFNLGNAMLPALGLFMIYAGIMMNKSKRNWFIGIRTPWTLSSDRVWNETHRLGAKLFIGSGILSLLSLFAGQYAIWLVMLPLLGSALFLVLYSYVLYQREPKEQK